MIALPDTISDDDGLYTLTLGGHETSKDGKGWYFRGWWLDVQVFVDCQFSVFDVPVSGVSVNEPRDIRAWVITKANEQAILKRDWLALNDMSRGGEIEHGYL